MSDPIQVTSSHRSTQKHQPIPAFDRPHIDTPPAPSGSNPSLDDHIFSSSPLSEDDYLSSSPELPKKMKMPSSEGKGLNRHTRHIGMRRKNLQNDADKVEASSFEGHNRIATFPLDTPQTSLKRSATGEKYSSRRSPTLPKKKVSVEDRTPIRIRDATTHSNSAPNLLHPDVPYRRTKSEMSIRTEKTTYPITSDISEMHVYSLGQLKHTYDRLKFHPDEAASQLFNSFEHYEEKREAIIQGMVDLRQTPLVDWQLKGFYTVLTMILSSKGGGGFISSFMEATGESRAEEVSNLAEHAIKILSKKKTPADILASIARITRHEIRTQTRETLFRETNLSSRLCREYGNFIWHKELNELVKTIKRYLPEKTLPSLSLKYDTAQSQLTEKGNTAGSVEDKLDENAERFMEFARTVLPQIFELSVPEELKEMLIARRKQIITFLTKNPGQDPEDPQITSRTYISEVIYLRILNTYLISKENSAPLNHVLGNLCRVIQSLAAESPFGTEQHDPIYQRLNPLFHEFIDAHRRFVDDNSLRPKNLETEPEELFV